MVYYKIINKIIKLMSKLYSKGIDFKYHKKWNKALE